MSCFLIDLLDLVDRDALLRAVFHAGQAVDAFGHVHGIGFAAFYLEHGLRAHIGAGAVTVAFILVDCYHVHGSESSFDKLCCKKQDILHAASRKIKQEINEPEKTFWH